MASIMLVLVLAVFSLGLSACSSDDSGPTAGATTDATPEATTGATSTGATGATGATTVATAAGCVDLTEGPVFTITISKFAYRPDCFTVNGSQAIRIVNKDNVLHSFTIGATQVDGDIEAGTTFDVGLPISGVLAPDTYDIYCKYHERLTGTVTVL